MGLEKLFDRYQWVARWLPASITLLPLIVTCGAVKTDLFAGAIPPLCGSAAAASGLVVLLMNLARARGKAVEADLLAAWGGWPTTVLLRHGNGRIDRFTKERYHAALQALCPGLILPTPAEERAAPARADELYRSATTRLIERRRDASYKLLHRENAQYGFRRNLLGLKPVALLLVLVALALAGGVVWVGLGQLVPERAALYADLANRSSVYAAVGVDLASLVLWLMLVRPRFVRLSADEYAMALLRTLDH